VGLALSASTALAQTTKGDSGDNGAAASSQNKGESGSGAGASNPDSVSGVVVEGARRPDNPPIPADKKAAYDAEVAKAEAWRRYRQSMPPATESTIGQAKDYPGLRSLLPGQDEASEGR
jgi:hypothetical protein